MSLIDNLIQQGWLKSPQIIKAFQKVKRIDFLPNDEKDLAETNEALPIGYSQTISQPLVVAFMLELLEPHPSDKILDIGSGSGWTTALLAHIVSQQENHKFQIPNPKQIQSSNNQNSKSKIVAIELIPELKEFGEKNVAKYNFIERGIVKFVCADGSKGYKEEAPYDKILCSAAIQDKAPQSWKEQLKIGGRIVTPIDSSVWLFIKKSEGEFDKIEYPGFAFVPLVQNKRA